MKWVYTLDIKDITDNYNKNINKSINKSKINEVMFSLAIYNLLKSKINEIKKIVGESEISEFEKIINKFKFKFTNITNIHNPISADEIDKILNTLYDWADKNAIWINTTI